MLLPIQLFLEGAPRGHKTRKPVEIKVTVNLSVKIKYCLIFNLCLHPDKFHHQMLVKQPLDQISFQQTFCLIVCMCGLSGNKSVRVLFALFPKALLKIKQKKLFFFFLKNQRTFLPTQLLGPIPNDINVYGRIFFLFSTENLSGSNLFGSGKYSGSR